MTTPAKGPQRKPAPETRPKKPTPEIPSRLTVLVGVLTFAGLLLTIAAAPPWAATAAIAAAVSACVLHRSVWRARPSPRGLAIVLTVTSLAGLVAHFAFETEEENPRPEASIERTASSLGSGQFGAGDIVRASAGDSSGTYSDPLSARLGSTVTVAIRLSNVGPDPVVGTRVVAGLAGDAASSLSVGLRARARNTGPSWVGDTATIELADGAEACLAYVPESSGLYDQHFGLIRGLPDGVTEGRGADWERRRRRHRQSLLRFRAEPGGTGGGRRVWLKAPHDAANSTARADPSTTPAVSSSGSLNTFDDRADYALRYYGELVFIK